MTEKLSPGSPAPVASQARWCDLMLDCVERRFNALRAPHPVQLLADNGSACTARETIDFATALFPRCLALRRCLARRATVCARLSSKLSNATTLASNPGQTP